MLAWYILLCCSEYILRIFAQQMWEFRSTRAPRTQSLAGIMHASASNAQSKASFLVSRNALFHALLGNIEGDSDLE